MAAAPDEAEVDEQIRETEKSIADLQKKRAELLRAKGAMRWAKSSANATKPGVQAVAPAPGVKEKVATAPPTPASLKALEKTLNELEWKSFKKKEGEWTFLRTMTGKL